MKNKDFKRIKKRDLAVKKIYESVDLYKLPTSFWFKKYNGAKRTHFAFIKYEDNVFYIYFVNELGQIFDRLPFNNIRTPKRLLRKNKFISSNNKKCDVKPSEPFEIKFGIGKKARPYSIGSLWKSQERYNLTDERWKDYQGFVHYMVISWNEYVRNTYGYYFGDLIGKTEKEKFCHFDIKSERIWDTDLKLYFVTKYGKSKLWLSSSANYISNIWRFLEAVIKSPERSIFYYCNENGTDSFLYVRRYLNDNVRFIHLSSFHKTSLEVVQNILISQREFIEKFYYAIVNGVKNYDKNNSKEYITKVDSNYDDFIDLIKGSSIVKTYLFGSG